MIWIKKIIGVYVVMVLIFTSAIVLVYCVPQSWIRENAIKSARQIQEEGVYPQILNVFYFQLDSYTDDLMIHTAISADNSHPIVSAMENVNYKSKQSPFFATEQVLNENFEGLEKGYYSRYWHGYVTLLRPLLIIMPYSSIRVLNYILFTALIVSLFVAIRKTSYAYAYIFIITLLLIAFPFVPCSMQFSTCFYIAFIGMLAVLKVPRLTDNLSNASVTFFVIGGFTSYLDLLVTPLLTLGFPLIAYFMLNRKDSKVRSMIVISLFWVLGYVSIWGMKWIIATIFTSRNILGEAVSQIIYRSGKTNDFGQEISLLSYWQLFGKHIISFHNGILLYIALLIMGILLYLYIRLNKGVRAIKCNVHYLLITSIVPVCFFCIRNHSFEHIWFTWRSFGVAFFSLILFVYNTIDIQKVKTLWRK